MPMATPASRLLLPPWVRDPLYIRAGQLPAFDLRFENGSIVDVIGGITPTFTRPSSTKLVWNGSEFVSVAADVPAFQRDPVTGRLGYLHEPATTNLFLNSATPATQGITVTAQAYTLSFYGTGTITLSGASTAGPLVGTGAEPNRVSLTFTPSAGTLTLTLSGSVTRPQLETGTVATSPIITAGSAVTRAADTMTVSGGNFSSWYNQLGGVLYAEAARLTSAPPGTIASINDASANNRLFNPRQDNATQLTVLSATGGSLDAFPIATLNGSALPNKIAIRQSLNSLQVSANGLAPVVDTSVAMPVVTQLEIGGVVGTVNYNGLFYRLCYFPPSSAQFRIQAVTT